MGRQSGPIKHAAIDLQRSGQRQRFEEMLAERDARIEQLQQELAEQERTLRHILTMLIEWFENEEPRRAA